MSICLPFQNVQSRKPRPHLPICPKPLDFRIWLGIQLASQMELVVKNPPVSAGDIRDAGLIPELGLSRGGGHGDPL